MNTDLTESEREVIANDYLRSLKRQLYTAELDIEANKGNPAADMNVLRNNVERLKLSIANVEQATQPSFSKDVQEVQPIPPQS